MGVKQNLVSSQSLGAFPSPTNYQDKGWSSERVPHPSGSSRRHVSGFTPFCSGRALPSKWEDAERWICSPVLGYGVAKNSQSQNQRQPKSKSGPIVPPGIAYYSNSPSIHVVDADGGPVKNFTVNSPFSTGVLMPNGVGVHYIGDGNGGQANLARMSSLPGWSDLVSDTSLPSSQDEKIYEINDAQKVDIGSVSRRDIATQMSSPEDSTYSSPRERSSSPPYFPPVLEPQSENPAKLEIREVQVDKGATVTDQFKNHGSSIIKRGLPDAEDFNHSAIQVHNLSCDASEATSDISKLQREEAKITAWENLQKAKAEAAIRKLEMKLEKKRASSMDKILNKLRTAQVKAEEMRSSIPNTQDNHVPKKPGKISSFNKRPWLNYMGVCFACQAY